MATATAYEMKNESQQGEVRQIGRTPTDADLIERIQRGDRWAQEVLFSRHVDAVMGTATKLLGSTFEAEDVVQDTFIRAFSKIDQITDPEAARKWLLSIAVRLVYRRFRRQSLFSKLKLSNTIHDATLDAMASEQANAEDLVELGMIDTVLRKKCSDVQRTAWLIHFVEGYSLQETAEICDCSISAVKRRVAAAHEKVRRQLQTSRGAS